MTYHVYLAVPTRVVQRREWLHRGSCETREQAARTVTQLRYAYDRKAYTIVTTYHDGTIVAIDA